MGVVQRRLAVPNVRQLVGREMLLVECRCHNRGPAPGCVLVNAEG